MANYNTIIIKSEFGYKIGLELLCKNLEMLNILLGTPQCARIKNYIPSQYLYEHICTV